MLTNSLPVSCHKSIVATISLRGALASLRALLSAYGKRLLPSGRTFHDPREQRHFNASRDYQVARARCERHF